MTSKHVRKRFILLTYVIPDSMMNDLWFILSMDSRNLLFMIELWRRKRSFNFVCVCVWNSYIKKKMWADIKGKTRKSHSSTYIKRDTCTKVKSLLLKIRITCCISKLTNIQWEKQICEYNCNVKYLWLRAPNNNIIAVTTISLSSVYDCYGYNISR